VSFQLISRCLNQECKDPHAKGKKHEGVVPWDAALYAKDPSSYQDIKSQEEMWEVSETEELFKMAVEFNVLMPKKEKKWRSEMENGSMTRDEVTRNLFALLRPVDFLNSNPLSPLSPSKSQPLNTRALQLCGIKAPQPSELLRPWPLASAYLYREP